MACLNLLTHEQALADYVQLIDEMKSGTVDGLPGCSSSNCDGSPVIAFGGSYGKGIDATSSMASLSKDLVALDLSSSSSDPDASAWFSLAEMPDPRDGLVKGYGLSLGLSLFAVTGSNSTGDYVDTNEVISLYCDDFPPGLRANCPRAQERKT